MRQRKLKESERDPVAMPAQVQESEQDPVEQDRFLEELMKAVDEDVMSEETSASQESKSPVPSSVPPRPERVRYSFD